MNEDLKVVFAGPVGAGKTTAIASLSDIEPITTDEAASDMAQSRKGHGHTTVAMDYGLMQLEGGERVHLFGTPGQERFDFMWDILSHGGLGLVLLLDNSRPNPFQDLKFFLEAFREFVARAPFVVGVTKVDLRTSPGVPEYAQTLATLGYPGAPVFEVDARAREDINTLLLTLLYCLDPGLGG